MKFFKNGIEISDIDVKCLENDLLDIEDWILKAIEGKINNCKKRLIKSGTEMLLKDLNISAIPAKEDEFIKNITSHPKYINRKEKDKILKKELGIE